MKSKEKWQAEFNSMKPSEKAIVANFFHMCSLYPNFEKAFDAWNRKNGGYTLEEFFDFLDRYEANTHVQSFCGQPILN